MVKVEVVVAPPTDDASEVELLRRELDELPPALVVLVVEALCATA